VRPQLTVTLPAPVTFDRVVLQEPIALGQRIASFEIEAETDGAWHRIGTGTTVGYKRILPVPSTRTSRVRVTIHSARSSALLAEVGLY
jgi:alpha-L-fucosidase